VSARRVLITGSPDGLGLMAARLLIEQGHEVTLHARSRARAQEALAAAPGAAGALHGDLASLSQTRAVAEQANALGRFDAVIHNAGIGYREPRRVVTEDGVEHVFQINVLAPYVLTALIERPDRLVYLSSGMHRSGDPDGLSDLQWESRRWNGAQAYADSKLYDAVLAAALARRWPDTKVNAVEPGWVATKMGGAGAPDDLAKAPVTQAWLAVSDDPEATVSGAYFYHQRPRETHPAVRDPGVHARLIEACAELSGVELPAA
jgi:NAD(P)-dependent dehydrogenase (short-subunit alcohol dehydrogenase family)